MEFQKEPTFFCFGINFGAVTITATVPLWGFQFFAVEVLVYAIYGFFVQIN